MPYENRLFWLDRSVYIHAEILYMVSPERKESKRKNKRM